jgi:hypothetical protein
MPILKQIVAGSLFVSLQLVLVMVDFVFELSECDPWFRDSYIEAKLLLYTSVCGGLGGIQNNPLLFQPIEKHST